MNGIVLTKVDVSALEKEALDPRGHLVIKPAEFWEKQGVNLAQNFMYKHGIYVLPTSELIEWLNDKILGSAIEIGAGNGSIGRALKIPITDSKMQDRIDIKLMYATAGQPTIKYPSDIEKLEASAAITKYKPQTVIGAFITHKYIDEVKMGNYWGVNEDFLLASVKRYLNIGNLETHKYKPILQIKHDSHYYPW